MATTTSTETTETRTDLTRTRGNFYYGLGFTLLAGLLVVVALGVLGITSMGVFSVTTAMAMTGIAIALLSVVSFVTLVTLRRTIELLSEHETAMAEQALRHADLAAKVQSQWHAEQIIRDRNQDADVAALSARQDIRDRNQDVDVAALSARQDASFVDAQGRSERKRLARGGQRPVASSADPFEGGQVHPVIDVEGIGEHYAKLLNDVGITDTEKLWNADATYVAGSLKITPAAVQGWQCMAELMAVTGIGKQYAELLVRADVSTIVELAAETPQPLLNRIQRLENRLEKHQGGRVQGNTIGVKIVQSWINAAQTHYGVAHVAVAGGSDGPGA